MSPGDVAYLIASSPPDLRDTLLGLLAPEQEALVVNELPEELRNAALIDRAPEALAEIVEQLDDDDSADILHELPEDITGRVLAIMDEQYRQRLQTVLSFPDDVAGGLMSTDTITIRADLTLDVVLRYLRRHAELPQIRTASSWSTVVVDTLVCCPSALLSYRTQQSQYER